MATEKKEVVAPKAPEREKFVMEFVGRRPSTRELKRLLATTESSDARRVLKTVFLGNDCVSYRKGGFKHDRVKKMFDAKNKPTRSKESADVTAQA